jgi:DNA-binding MarR family transcriptional regulator
MDVSSPVSLVDPQVDPSTCALPDENGSSSLDGDALEAWRSYLQSHATILRLLDAELISEHGITTRDYEVLLYLAQAPDRKLPMSALAESTMLTRSGITRLVDGLVAGGFIERVSCPSDARVSYAQLTDVGLAKLRDAGCTHVRSIRRLFLEHFSPDETSALAALLGRLPGAQRPGACTVD